MKSNIKKLEITESTEKCPKCSRLMERRKYKERPAKKFYYEKWDFCPKCNHVQHYDDFKNLEWQELDRQRNHFKSI